MRKTKRELLAADATDDKDRFTEKSVLLRRQKEEYNKFSKAAGLLTENQRTQVEGFGHSQASRAACAAKKTQTASGGSSAPISGGTPTSTKGKSPDNSPANASRAFKTKSELEKMSLAQLRKETKELAKEFCSSGKLDISFGNADIDKVAEKLANGASKTALIKDYMSLQKRISGLDKLGGSGTMDIGSELPMNALTRKAKPDDYIEPMPQKQFQRICKSFKFKGGIIQISDATDEYLKSKNAEAITYDSKTILLKQNPSSASVFEELIHTPI